MDGSPGATTLLMLAARGAITRFDAVLVPDTRWYPAQTYRHLERLRRIATNAAMAWVRIETSSIARDSLDGRSPCPLPLFTLSPDGTPGQLPQGCARRQALAWSSHTRRLLGYPHPAAVPDRAVAECATGEGLEHARYPMASGPRYVLFCRPLVDIGWTSQDCRAFLRHHGLGEEAGMACVACPNRSNHGWAHLRTADPATFTEAVAADSVLRHGYPGAETRGMPDGTLYYLHPDRVPLERADLASDTGFRASGCLPWACHGHEPHSTARKDGTR